ncbi:hypothetical protein SeLEV6574_g07020, partial [Synchytrium endobioticum]
TQLDRILNRDYDNDHRNSAAAGNNASSPSSAMSLSSTSVSVNPRPIAQAAEPPDYDASKPSDVPSVSRLPSQKNKKGGPTVIDYSKWETFNDDEQECDIDATAKANTAKKEGDNGEPVRTKPVLRGKTWQEEQTETVIKIAEKYRQEGNGLFVSHKYHEAIAAYTNSIHAFLNPQSIIAGSQEHTGEKNQHDPFAFLDKYRQPLQPLPVLDYILSFKFTCVGV